MKPFVAVVFLLILTRSFGQLVTNTSQSPAALVQNVLLGPGVTVSNIQYTGARNTIGSFTATNTNLGISSGIVMTTGTVVNNGDGPQGPNNKSNAGVDNHASGFNLLNNLLGGGTTTKNAAYLQMDFVPMSDTVRFRYVFGSEEYPEFVKKGFNDVFAFFISGPGISGQQNIAKLPNGTPVTIDNVNAGSNSAYFVYNGDGSQSPFDSSPNYIQYDGFTKVMTAVSKVQCGQTYHLILAIADAGDGIFDSGIFLEANSLKSNVDMTFESKISYQAYSDPNTLAEGCVSGAITIKRSGNFLPAVSIPITTMGTATNGNAGTPGADYGPKIPSTLNFSQGETEKIINFSAFGDNVSEGVETILLSFLAKDGCGNPKPVELDFSIKDPEPLSVTVESGKPTCPGDKVEVIANVTGGVGPFTYRWNTGETTSSIFVNPSSTSVYIVTVSDDCLATSVSGSGTVSVPIPQPLTIHQTPNITEICPYITKTLESNVTGGTPPYTYQWSGTEPPVLGTDSIQDVTPHVSTVYSIEVKDHCGEIAVDYVTYLITSPELTLEMSPNVESCPGDSVLISVTPSGGHPVPEWKYYYSWKHDKTLNDSSIWVKPYKTTTYEVSVWDSCGTFTVEGTTTVTVVKPTANFIISSPVRFENLPITFQNLTQNATDFKWDFGDGNTSTKVHPNNTYLDTGTYLITLIVEDLKGCVDSIKRLITIEEEYYVYVPNAFTPGSGRINETFKASLVGIKTVDISIFNRWGEIVFESDDLSFSWDGRYKGAPAQPGLYTYKMTCLTNSRIPLYYTGHVTIVR